MARQQGNRHAAIVSHPAASGRDPHDPRIAASAHPLPDDAPTQNVAAPTSSSADAGGTLADVAFPLTEQSTRRPPPPDHDKIAAAQVETEKKQRQRALQVSAFPSARNTLPWPMPGVATTAQPHHGRKHRWRGVMGRTISKAWNDSLFSLSAEGAFWSALSTAPLLLALLGLIGFSGQWFGTGVIAAVEEQVLAIMHGLFSSEVVDSLLQENVSAMLHNGQADLVSVGFFVSLWAGSSAISSFMDAITIAYQQYEVRNPAVERFFALALYLFALIAGTVVLPLLAIGPEALAHLFPDGIRSQATYIINIAYYPGIVISLVLLLATLYKVAPRYKHPWRRGIPGALLAAGIFLVASFGLRLYVSYVYTHGLTYGALATPITFLLFYYMMSLAIVMGAQFNNATLEYFPPKVSRREMRKWRRLPAPTDDTDL